jgi:hypothetical protein
MAAEAAEAVMAVAVVGDAPRMSGAVVVAAMAVGATAAMAVIAAALGAVAPASFLAAAAAVEAAAEGIGAGLTACGPGALITGAISLGQSGDASMRRPARAWSGS